MQRIFPAGKVTCDSARIFLKLWLSTSVHTACDEKNHHARPEKFLIPFFTRDEKIYGAITKAYLFNVCTFSSPIR
jgi:hypothetical protein